MKQLTAIEWLIDQVEDYLGDIPTDIIEQAKEMEKEQIVEAFYEGVDQESDTHGAQNLDMKDAENYYNETFKTK